MSKASDLEAQYGAHNYHPLDVELTRGQGIYLWDIAGRRYIDMMSAYSAVSFGHSHPRLVAALSAQASQLAVTSRAFRTDRLGPFLARLCTLTGQDRALPMNTGAEAVETAIKAARKWAYKVKGVAAERAEIVVCKGNFAGRTTTIVGFSSEAQYRDGFGPFTPGFRQIPFGDSGALEAAMSPNTAAFIVEPIQGEAGIIVPPRGYLARCAEICRRHRVLLICDEVQTGLGRTGSLLAAQQEGVVPDGVTLGKALGGGLLPVSAFLASREVMDVFAPGDHGSTFGGNPLAAAVGLTALDLLIEEDLSTRAAKMGALLRAGLKDIGSPLVGEVRGQGLLIGMEVNARHLNARTACEKLARFGILSKDTHDTVVRFAPPLIITEDQVEAALVAIDRAFAELEHEAGVTRELESAAA